MRNTNKNWRRDVGNDYGGEYERLRRADAELKSVKTAIEIVKLLQPFTCGERQDIERRIKEILR